MFNSTRETVNTHYLLTCLHLSTYEVSLSNLTLLPFQAKSILIYLGYPQTDNALYLFIYTLVSISF